MSGQLLPDYFLTHGIKDMDEWKASVAQPAAFDEFRDGVLYHYNIFIEFHDPNEAVTEQDLIRPVLGCLGWTDYLPQQSATRHEDIPDLLLFSNANAKACAARRRRPEERYMEALAVEESKRFGLSLDGRDADARGRSRTPHGQILRYLSTAEIASEGRLRWGILTDGGVWRLYDYRTRPRATGYYEADLSTLLKPGNEDDLRVFFLLFRRDSFICQDGATATFLEAALAEGRRYEERVAQDISGVVFDPVFRNLIQAIAAATSESLAKIREAALIFLYRLLFVLYAEDRSLLPVSDSRYDDYGLRKRVRKDVADRMVARNTFSTHATNYYDHLMTLFKIIDKGDTSIGLPPYNGGLFAPETAALLEDIRLTDATIAPIIYAMSHAGDPDESHRFVNYRDLSVQQLGSIYERLLEREPVRDDDGNIVIRLNPYARKDSGSFFTSQDLVDLIVDRTLKPLAEERLNAFTDKSAALKNDRRAKTERQAEMRKLDPAEAVLNLKVMDPAMGSGHFLVTAVDFLSDYIADLIERTPAIPEWLDGEYVSPLVDRVANIRRDILQRAEEAHWVMDESRLTDQAIIRRMVLKRCIYGVDKNPLTVELAKVSLWLHSFTVGAPLSFLDHHLRCGDSLVGLRVSDATGDLRSMASLFLDSAIAGAEAATESMQRIEEMSDADAAEVRESATLFHGVEGMTAELRGLLDFFCGLRWLTAGMTLKKRSEFKDPLVTALGYAADAYKLLVRGPESMGDTPPDSDSAWLAFAECWRQCRTIADRERFLHWEVAFPGVWRRWQSSRPEGGFDAIIGNPPWDRIKLQEVEWFATRDRNIALAPTASARRARIRHLRDGGASLAAEFDEAKAQAEDLKQMIRSYDDYPFLGTGDINLYSLFVERAMHLIKPDGFIGLLTPSGIYADQTAARFFKSVSTSGRLGGLFDFENRRIFFEDIDARFKFCALIFGGEARRFDETKCAFFLHDTQTVKDPDRCFPLAPADFARVNPNTGTAPVFRTRRDADITRRIYERHPVLVDRSTKKVRKAWPVRYVGMFHMTNDSHLFRTAAQLEHEGFYPVESNRWKRDDELYLPLYEGKMVQAFDHRAASVVVNPENLNRPAQPRETTDEEHANPDWLPAPQFWVSVDWPEGLEWTVAFKHVTAPTNVRTMIASVVPSAGFGNSLPVFLPGHAGEKVLRAYKEIAPLLTANLNAFAFDFVTRQKVQGQNLNLFLVEQLPVIGKESYARQFGDKTARELIRDHVLRLTYTAHDMALFARDLGYAGPPFVWNDKERHHLCARLDALYFHLYGLNREDAAYILDTFPIVRQKDEARFGAYRTSQLILAYMNALATGDTETIVAG